MDKMEGPFCDTDADVISNFTQVGETGNKINMVYLCYFKVGQT